MQLHCHLHFDLHFHLQSLIRLWVPSAWMGIAAAAVLPRRMSVLWLPIHMYVYIYIMLSSVPFSMRHQCLSYSLYRQYSVDHVALLRQRAMDSIPVTTESSTTGLRLSAILSSYAMPELHYA